MDQHRREHDGGRAGAAGEVQTSVRFPEAMVKDVRNEASRTQESVKRHRGLINVVTREEIQRARPKNADEMLRRVPGVNVLTNMARDVAEHRHPGYGSRRSKNILLMMDDIPIQPALFGDASTYYMGADRNASTISR